ncbi:hypothetical protein J2128_002098 [Methanomicrobium sp. W14]|nr:hypothetical protein [Methanomicrobium sp. W14]
MISCLIEPVLRNDIEKIIEIDASHKPVIL